MAYFGLSHPRNQGVILDLVRMIDPASVVDIGCGGGTYARLVRDTLPECAMVGIEAYADNANPLWALYDEVLVSDARTIDLPPADLYLLVDVIEHMSRVDGFMLGASIPGPVIVCTPRHWPQAADENPYTEHVSEWTEADFDFALDMSDEEFVIGLVL